jgi:hypothetical protein
MLRCALKKQDRVVWTAFIWFRIGTGIGHLEYCNEPFSIDLVLSAAL